MNNWRGIYVYIYTMHKDVIWRLIKNSRLTNYMVGAVMSVPQKWPTTRSHTRKGSSKKGVKIRLGVF